MVRTLNNLSELKKTRFGQPPPRHGLNLLWWFAHECVQIDSNRHISAKCNPANGAFGFHRFYNRDRLLPYTDLPYYEVGNLKTTDSLPDYVTESYTGYSDKSNTDRIIVSFDSLWNRFENIYVTQHSDLVHFDQNHTYRIGLDLLKGIKKLSREDFPRGRTNRSEHIAIDIPQSMQVQPYQRTFSLKKKIQLTSGFAKRLKNPSTRYILRFSTHLISSHLTQESQKTSLSTASKICDCQEHDENPVWLV
ncbi:hypothetical protein Q8A67_005135 [Cirrhinus molitorella]|uniref:Uncharacterized protein n=1 Tax=Cirrhinus molitorella TaxID=172907 RepID=A0AA88QCY6_9TELE|nr:hypothetical protein Q8A67_005135 [Cirrhinus molitorella]